MKNGVNRSDINKIKRMMADGCDAKTISQAILVNIDVVQRNIEHLSKSKEDLDKFERNKKRALKAARTRALKRQAEELARKAAEAEVEEEMT